MWGTDSDHHRNAHAAAKAARMAMVSGAGRVVLRANTAALWQLTDSPKTSVCLLLDKT